MCMERGRVVLLIVTQIFFDWAMQIDSHENTVFKWFKPVDSDLQTFGCIKQDNML